MANKHRKLIVCCDGTWNTPDQEGAPSNVVKIARAIRPSDADGAAQVVYYHPGVGTGNVVDRFMGGTMGIGLSANVQACYDFLATNYQSGDKIYLFGFSRGAYTARSIAGLIGAVGGLLEKQDMDLFPFVFRIYRSREHRPALKIATRKAIEAAVDALFAGEIGDRRGPLVQAILNARSTRIFFIGVWDTVGALGIPLGWARWIGKRHYDFHDTDLSERVRYAYHAIAIDERRKSFEPALWTRPKGRGADKSKTEQTLEQVWFAGVHSNIGGGYADAGLSDLALLWLMDKAAAARWTDDTGLPLAFDEGYLKSKIVQTMGMLNDSAKGLVWKLSGLRDRDVLRPPPDGKETCESIHWSARFRLECKEKDKFAPYPYSAGRLRAALDQPGCTVTTLSGFERKYHPWPEDAPPPPGPGKPSSA